MLPPATIINQLNLTLNLEELCWTNDNDEPIIRCNNNRSYYFSDPIMGTVYMRKDIFDSLTDIVPIKYFAFSEKYLDPYGYCDETAYHFEVVNGRIEKSVANYQHHPQSRGETDPEACKDCRYGFYKSYDEPEQDSPIIRLIMQYSGEWESQGSDE